MSGVFITYDKKNPQKWIRCPHCNEKLSATGGTAHFIFETSLSNTVQKYLEVYNSGTADADLDRYLEGLETFGKITSELRAEIENKIALALVVYGRKFLDSYTAASKDLRDKVQKFVVAGGEPVYHEGKLVGMQNFELTKLK